jgi:hypothetical protein
VSRFERNVLTLLDMCRRARATLVLTTFVYDEARLEPSYAAGVRRRNEAARAVARREGAPLVDLERAFAEVPSHADYFFPDAYHPNERGAEWIASVLAERWPEVLAQGPGAPAASAGRTRSRRLVRVAQREAFRSRAAQRLHRKAAAGRRGSRAPSGSPAARVRSTPPDRECGCSWIRVTRSSAAL